MITRLFEISLAPTWPRIATFSPDRSAGLQAFAQIERVLLHPRCVNCHVPDGPLQGDAKRMHYPAVQRGVDGKGVAPLNCVTCHSTQNSPLAHAPPGLDTGGQPGWRMPPAKMKMSWFGLSGSALCKVFRDPGTNGGRSLAMLQQHMATDHLVAWGWQPGPGRELPPLSLILIEPAGAVPTLRSGPQGAELLLLQLPHATARPGSEIRPLAEITQ